MFLCGDVLYIQIKKWYVKFGATGSLSAVRITTTSWGWGGGGLLLQFAAYRKYLGITSMFHCCY